MSSEKRLIVNADDFGRSTGINKGIIRAHQDGIVTSASLIVRWPAAAEAAELARRNPNLSIGLHLDVSEWTCQNGSWSLVYQVIPPDDCGALRQEVSRQLAEFRSLMGCDPSHIDSHQHAHLKPPLTQIAEEAARDIGVPLRERIGGIRYDGRFYGQSANGWPYPEGITPAALIRICENLPQGITELGCHPSEDEDLDSMYLHERTVELEALCDPRMREALGRTRIRLCSFLEAAALMPAPVGGSSD